MSTDYIKQKTRRDEFAVHCPDLVVVDEAHTCVAPSSVRGGQAHLRFALLRRLADDAERHLLLLTATPHNGDDVAWQSLLGLLDKRLEALPSDLSGQQHDENRKLLANFLIQRQRADIREYLDEDTPFPDRYYAEEHYKLTEDYRRLFDRVLAYARESVKDPQDGSKVRQRVRWWSAIALLRCLASSPAAAEQTLLNRSDLAAVTTEDDADALAGPRVFDSDLDDATDGEDAALGSDTTTEHHPDEAARRKLRQFAKEAADLRGPDRDAKLKRAIAIVRKLHKDGYHPILYCRYIPTAEYVAEHLAYALRQTDAKVAAVTGTLPPEDREDRVAELMKHPGARVLVATDCLSEGVNLQDGFTAVVHYDLAWNPTRHEQREGRVDRFGQQAPTVRAVTYYGSDNLIDGVVLDVLIRRHEAIKKSTGISVPVPVDSATVMEAVWESLLLRGAAPEQLTLDLGAHVTGYTADAVLTDWQDAAEREKASRSRFRQATLRPDQVGSVLAEVRRALGGPADAERFTHDALSHLGAHITSNDDGFTVSVATLPPALRDQLPPSTEPTFAFAAHFQPLRATRCWPEQMRSWKGLPATRSTQRSTLSWARTCDQPDEPPSSATKASRRSRRCSSCAAASNSSSRAAGAPSRRSRKTLSSWPTRSTIRTAAVAFRGSDSPAADDQADRERQRRSRAPPIGARARPPTDDSATSGTCRRSHRSGNRRLPPTSARDQWHCAARTHRAIAATVRRPRHLRIPS